MKIKKKKPATLQGYWFFCIEELKKMPTLSRVPLIKISKGLERVWLQALLGGDGEIRTRVPFLAN